MGTEEWPYSPVHQIPLLVKNLLLFLLLTTFAHAEEHYAVQARLYALGVARMLQIRDAADHEARFGGVIYCFVRGLGAPVGEGSTPGLHLMLPTFSDLERWDRALRTEDAPWGHPLPPRPAAHPGAEVTR